MAVRDVGEMVIIPIGPQPAERAPEQPQPAPYGVQQAGCGTQTTLAGSATTKITGTQWDVDAGVDVD